MFMKKGTRSFLFTLLAVAAMGSQSNAQEAMTIKIDPLKKSIDAGIKMEPGDIIEVMDVKGQIWASGPGGGGGGKTFTGSPNIPNTPGYANSYQYAKATPHSLVAYVGNPSNHFQIRKSIFQAAPIAGNLFFAFNDNAPHYGDNKGEWLVTYRIIKKAKICSSESGARLNFEWVNKTGAPITISWINFQCKEETPKPVKPNEAYSGNTAVGHVFRIRDAKNNEIGLVTVEPTSAKVDILPKKS